MRRLVWVLAVALLAGSAVSANAVPNNLENGVFICHYESSIVASPPAEGYGQHYLDNYAITSCDGQVTRIDVTTPVVWFVLSAWDEDKTWCGTEFGFGEYDPYNFVITAFGAIAPGAVLEIPTDYWPGPNEGIGIVTTDVAWTGNFQPVYYFEGYASTVPGLVPLGVDPPTDSGGWSNCDTPPVEYDATCFGAMGFQQDGVECCPEGGAATGACCLPDQLEACQVMTEAACVAAGGAYEGDDTTCDGDPCPATGACCLPDEKPECQIMTQAACEADGGTYAGDGVDCVTADCPEVWACCIEDVCYLRTEENCDDGGVPPWETWFPGQECGEGGIDCSTPIEETSWGQIKSIYR